MNSSGRPQILPAGARLAQWIAAGGPPTRDISRVLPWLYRWNGWWFDRNWNLQRRLYLPASLGEGEALIFVMGYWRSGTTLLHELLSLGPSMAAPNTWQCMNPASFRLAKRPPPIRKTVRPMDAVVISTVSPQEDEFALLARGAPSVYRAWIDPRRWEETSSALDQETWLGPLGISWLVDWQDFLGWCWPDDAQALVIKSPTHVFRLESIQKAWPKAKFVWTLRDPVDTWFSNRKMWLAMMDRYALWHWRLDDLDRLLFRAFQEYAKALRTLQRLGLKQCFAVDFEYLSRNTLPALQDIIDGLKLGRWPDWRPLVQSRIDASPRHARETHPTEPSLPDYGLGVIEEIRSLQRVLLAKV